MKPFRFTEQQQRIEQDTFYACFFHTSVRLTAELKFMHFLLLFRRKWNAYNTEKSEACVCVREIESESECERQRKSEWHTKTMMCMIFFLNKSVINTRRRDNASRTGRKVDRKGRADQGWNKCWKEDGIIMLTMVLYMPMNLIDHWYNKQINRHHIVFILFTYCLFFVLFLL